MIIYIYVCVRACVRACVCVCLKPQAKGRTKPHTHTVIYICCIYMEKNIAETMLSSDLIYLFACINVH